MPSSSRRKTVSRKSKNARASKMFAIEKVVGHKTESDGLYLKVRWVGYDPIHDTWEPARNIRATANESVLDYFDTLPHTVRTRLETGFNGVRLPPAQPNPPVEAPNNSAPTGTSMWRVVRFAGVQNNLKMFLMEHKQDRAQVLLNEREAYTLDSWALVSWLLERTNV